MIVAICPVITGVISTDTNENSITLLIKKIYEIDGQRIFQVIHPIIKTTNGFIYRKVYLRLRKHPNEPPEFLILRVFLTDNERTQSVSDIFLNHRTMPS